LETNNDFGYLDVDQYYTTVHPEWNLLLFVGVGYENDIVAYNMDNRKVHFIPTCYNAFSDGMSCHKTSAPYYLPYVPLFSESESLAEE
jgi:outer membrane scaffolding protein for murein synthesis (MipA/OmpV family)